MSFLSIYTLIMFDIKMEIRVEKKIQKIKTIHYSIICLIPVFVIKLNYHMQFIYFKYP